MTTNGKYAPGAIHQLWKVEKMVGMSMDGFGGSPVMTIWTDDESLLLLIKRFADVDWSNDRTTQHRFVVGADGSFYDGSFHQVHGVTPEKLWTKEHLREIEYLQEKMSQHLTPEREKLLADLGIFRRFNREK